MSYIMQFEAVLPIIRDSDFRANYKEYDRLILPELYHRPLGIHGVNHVRRTLLIAFLMASFDQLSTTQVRILGYASVYHDIGRTHDGVDDYHGYASYKKVIKLGLLNDQKATEVGMIKELIERHAISDKNAFSLKSVNEDMQDEVNFLLRYFKDADGLDRVRLGDLNADYLRTDTAKKMTLVAHQILKYSEEKNNDYFADFFGDRIGDSR